MTNSLNRFAIATLLAVAASGTGMFSGVGAAGTHSDGHGGAVCKGSGSCLVLQLDCKGTYTDATQPDGTVYGKCSQTARVKPGFKAKLRAN